MPIPKTMQRISKCVKYTPDQKQLTVLAAASGWTKILSWNNGRLSTNNKWRRQASTEALEGWSFQVQQTRKMNHTKYCNYVGTTRLFRQSTAFNHQKYTTHTKYTLHTQTTLMQAGIRIQHRINVMATNHNWYWVKVWCPDQHKQVILETFFTANLLAEYWRN